MPGVIGASIFSPRPARGYRFHSLQVEIILVPSRRRKPQSFVSNFRPGSVCFCCDPNYLLQKSVPEIRPVIKISWISPEVTGNAGEFAANYDKCCSSVALPHTFSAL